VRHGHRRVEQLHLLLALEHALRRPLAAQRQQALDGRRGVGRRNDDQLARRHAADGLRPGPAARGVEQHLRLVDHGHIHRLARIGHLNRAADHPRMLGRHALLAREQRARHAAPHQAVAAFKREQAQRR
jgi:hypothetical protein